MPHQLPSWLTTRAPRPQVFEEMTTMLRSLSLHTVCEEAHCPNIGECFARRTATFMILGNHCTRNCRFCAVTHGHPAPPDPVEPARVAAAVHELGLRYVVITSVTRDDLADGGAAHFAQTIRELQQELGSELGIEVLIPDFQGNEEAVRMIAAAQPTVVNHNLETVPRLYPTVRPQARYARSLEVLERTRDLSRSIVTKSGLMLGLGERAEEVRQTMTDLRGVGCDILTLGQYLRPSPEHHPVKRFVPPEEFTEYEHLGYDLGFRFVASGPFVRSSYRAAEAVWGRPSQKD